jgi:DNA-binding response OmpR family regulator/signal transduction histidine kinase
MSDPVRILCIEDNPMNWRLVQRLLSQAGYEMHWAAEGLKGCEMALALTPALILLDINLPDLSGFEVATKLRQNPNLADTLIVALTAKSLRHDRETALVTGCDGFISKPIDTFLFVAQVEAYLGGQRDHLELGREKAALRQFSQQVVDHLEVQLREAQESNRKLLEAQDQLEQRSQSLSRLLSLSQDIIPLRDAKAILLRVLEQLATDLRFEHLCCYHLHDSGAYFQGLARTPEGFAETAVLPMDHPLAVWAEALVGGKVRSGAELRQSGCWQLGIELKLWAPLAQPLLIPLRSRSGRDQLWGFLAADRSQEAYLPFELELVAMHTGLLHGSLENAGLIAHLEETSRALATSYEGMETAYVELKEAQRALGAQNQRTALGGLFLNMARRLEGPVHSLRQESSALAEFMDRPEVPAPEDRVECHRAMGEIQGALDQVDRLVRAMLRRAGQDRASSPEWLNLHELFLEELELSRAAGLLPGGLRVELELQAPVDRIYGVSTDFTDVLGHLLEHALEGEPGRITLRSADSAGLFQLEVEDDGAPIDPAFLAAAFEPFPALRPEPLETGRRPGHGLSASVQLMNAYGGTVEILPLERGSRVRISLPLE